MLKNLIFLFGFSTFVTVVWITSTIYHNSTTSKISLSNQEKIKPISSKFDTQTLERLDVRQEIIVNLSDQLSIIKDSESINTETEDENIASESGVLGIKSSYSEDTSQ